MPDFTFALGTPDDAALVLALYRSLVGMPGCSWDLGYPDEETLAEDISTGSLYVLRHISGALVAAISAGPFGELDSRQWSAVKNPCELARLGVAPPWQGRGLAGRMVQQAEQAARARGFGGICLMAGAQNPAAIAVYQGLGYACRGPVHMFDHDFIRYDKAFEQPPAAPPAAGKPL